MRRLVLFEMVGLAVDPRQTACDTVGMPSDHRAEEQAVARIVVDVGKPEDQRKIRTGEPQINEARAKFRHPRRQPPVADLGRHDRRLAGSVGRDAHSSAPVTSATALKKRRFSGVLMVQFTGGDWKPSR